MSDNHLFGDLAAGAAGPESVFLHTEAGERLIYGQAFARSAQLANAIVAAGVRPGERVAAQVEKSVDALLLYLAVVRAGAVFLPLNTGYTPAEIRYFLEDSEASLFVCDPENEDALTPVAHQAGVRSVSTLGQDGRGSLQRHADAASSTFVDVARGGEDLAAILYTSGTTGRSKGAMLTHENLLSNAKVLKDFWRFSSGDVLLHALPIYHTHGLFVATNVMLACGGSIILLSKFDAERVMRELPRATAMMGVPTFYTRLLQDPRLNRDSTKHIRLFVSGSAPLLAETHREWRERTGHAILERYGMTETNMNTSNPYDGERRPGTVGFPLPGTEVRIVDPVTGARSAAGEIGMIEVRGPNVFKGYWRMPDKTAAELRPDGFFITGDLGTISADGYVSIVGRGKDLIISGGLNVYPKEIEEAIDAIDGVLESAVIGIPHADFGEGVTAVVVPRAGAELQEKQLAAHLAERLAKFKLPKRIFIIGDLPRNAMGKVQKNVLRERYNDIYAA